MIYGYVRVSTKYQSIDRQILNITKEYPNAIIYSEKMSGTKLYNRKEFNKLLSIVSKGDVIVFDSVSRMSRNSEEGYNLYEELYNKGIELVFIKEPHINTSTYKKALANNIPMTNSNVDSILKGVNEYLMLLAKEQIRLAFIQSEKEVLDLQQRTKEGMKVAKANGKQIGRALGTTIETNKAKKCKGLIMKHSKKFEGSLNDKECMQLCSISKGTFYRYVKELEVALN